MDELYTVDDECETTVVIEHRFTAGRFKVSLYGDCTGRVYVGDQTHELDWFVQASDGASVLRLECDTLHPSDMAMIADAAVAHGVAEARLTFLGEN